MILTWLYAPAVRPELMAKALTSGADAVIYDLEDSVLPARKDEARAALLTQLDTLAGTPAADRAAVHVRVNAVGSPHAREDVRAIAGSPALAGLRLPKVTGPGDVLRVADWLGPQAERLELLCVLESALGVHRAYEIATAHPSVRGLAIGEADLVAELGVRGEAALGTVRSTVVLAAAAAGLPPPAMAVYTDVRDDAGLAESCRLGRDLGMFGRAAIHPRQLPVIEHAFRPEPDEVAAARAVLEAGARAVGDGSGAFVLPDGRFVDAPVIAAARRTIALADRNAD